MRDNDLEQITQYIADLALQKYEQCQALKSSETTGQFIDYCISMGYYLCSSHILEQFRDVKIKGVYQWKQDLEDKLNEK